jgi:hypothetical protein
LENSPDSERNPEGLLPEIIEKALLKLDLIIDMDTIY